MPVRGFNLILLFLLPMPSFLTPVTSLPQPSQCQLVQKTAFCNNGMLSTVPARLLPDLEELQLNYNYIQTLQNLALRDYPSLNTLGLACNHLEKIEANVFEDSKLIETLHLADNNLNIGYEETAVGLRKLRHLRFLDLSKNKLDEEMTFTLLQNLTSLEYLNLSGNTLRRLDETAFKDLLQLKDLDLQRNILFEIVNAFDSNSKLQRLNLAFNYLPCLTDFHMTNLVILNASYNFIEWFISSQDLNDTFQLETLDLSNNKLLFFPFLPSRSKLQHLYLSHNVVKFYEHLASNVTSQTLSKTVEFYNLNKNNVTAQLWEEDLHGDISSLSTLDLRGNQVEYFPHGFFKKMSTLSRLQIGANCMDTLNLVSEQFADSLYELDVSNNRLSQIMADEVALRTLGNLTYFNLSLNNLDALPFGLFSMLPRIRSVDLSYNNIGICPLDDDAFQQSNDSVCVEWSKIASLRRLYLKGCNLEMIPTSAFTGLSLTHLELSDNPGLVVHNALHSLRRTLQHLGLGNTQIQDFDFSHFQSLRFLNLSRNSLLHLPSSIQYINLEELDVRDNNLSTIPHDQAYALTSKLQTIFLTGNPFNCCQTEWFRTFETAKRPTMVRQTDIECKDIKQDTHKVKDSRWFNCWEAEESALWYILLLVPIFVSFAVISIVFFITFKPKLLQKSIKKRYLKPTSY